MAGQLIGTREFASQTLDFSLDNLAIINRATLA